jgi:hypothetical protein
MCRRGGRAILDATRDKEGRFPMARILITIDRTRTRGSNVMLDERIATSDLDSDHFAAALIERIGWPRVDADDAELMLRSH